MGVSGLRRLQDTAAGISGTVPDRLGGIGLLLVLVSVIVMGPSAASAAAEGYRPPSKTDKCHVCGMFVYKYPDWIAAVRLKDGSLLYFDGAKDMFNYVLGLKTPESEKIAALYVTEYYGLEVMDARKAYFVIGSDVYGPMGRELLPFKSRAEAEEFKRDHKGKAVLAFGEVTAAMVAGLDVR